MEITEGMMMKPVVRETAPSTRPSDTWCVPGHCYDAVPTGQKDAYGNPSVAWLKNRGRLVVSGTNLGYILPKGHPLRSDRQSRETVMKSYVFNDRKNYNQFQLDMFKKGNDGESVVDGLLAAEGYKMHFPGLLVSEHSEYVGGSPDGVFKEVPAICEIKTIVSRKPEFDSDGQMVIPQYYHAQPHLYMWMTNTRRCMFVQYCYKTGQMWKTWLDYNEEAMETAIPCMMAFVNETVERRREWLAMMDDMRTSIEFFECGIIVPKPVEGEEQSAEERDAQKKYTPIGMRYVNVEDRLLRALTAARQFVEANNTHVPRKSAPRKRRERASMDPEYEIEQKFTEAELAEIQKTMKEE